MSSSRSNTQPSKPKRVRTWRRLARSFACFVARTPRWQRLMIAVCLLLLLSGCAGEPVVVTQTRVMVPPPAWLLPTPEPSRVIEHCGDLLEFGREALAALASCNADKARVSEWAKRMTETGE